MGALKSSLLVFGGAGAGALCRFWFGSLVQAKMGGVFPVGTLLVNCTGCLLIGIVMTVILGRPLTDGWRFLLVTGVLGGYTTFSSFAYETFALVANRHASLALLYVASSNVLTLAGCWLGVAIGRALLPS